MKKKSSSEAINHVGKRCSGRKGGSRNRGEEHRGLAAMKNRNLYNRSEAHLSRAAVTEPFQRGPDNHSLDVGNLGHIDSVPCGSDLRQAEAHLSRAAVTETFQRGRDDHSSDVGDFGHIDSVPSGSDLRQPGAFHIPGVRYHNRDEDEDSQNDDRSSVGVEVGIDIEALPANRVSGPEQRHEVLGRLRGRLRVIEALDVKLESGWSSRKGIIILGLVSVAIMGAVLGGVLGTRDQGAEPPKKNSTMPHDNGTNGFECFQSRGDLEKAVDAYLDDSSANTSFAQRYGWPMNTWCVSRITDFSSLFSSERNPKSSQFNENLSDWDVSSATSMTSMFGGAQAFNCDISSWDVSNVVYFNFLFSLSTSFNANITAWNVSGAQSIDSMFKGAWAFNQDPSRWKVSRVTSFRDTFYWATAFNGNVSTWDVSAATDMHGMFSFTQAFNQDISGWSVAQVISFESMFEGAEQFDQNLSPWKVVSAKTMSNMFRGAWSFNQDLSSWAIDSVSDFRYMFSNATNFNQDLCAWGPAIANSSARVDGMFENTACPKQDPVNLLGSPPGPFCSECIA